MAAAFIAALLGIGIAVGAGAVQTPLTANLTKAPRAATLAPSPSLAKPTATTHSTPTAKASPTKKPTHHATPSKSPSHTPTPTMTASHSMAPTTAPSSHAATSSGLVAQPTAEYQTPRGQNQLAWSEAILTALGAPLTNANILSIGYWMQNEAGSPPYGIVGANNPINVSQPCCGGVPIKDDGDGVTFLQSYPTVADGVQAIAEYLNRGNYTAILADLKAGAGLSDPSLASEIGLYSGGGYTTIPDSYGASQGQPLTP